MFFPEGFQLRLITGDQRFRGQLGEPGGKQLFVTVAQALRLIDDKRALFFGAFEDVGRVDKLGIEWRIFTHQNDVKVRERQILLAVERVPFVVVLLDAQLARTGAGFTVD